MKVTFGHIGSVGTVVNGETVVVDQRQVSEAPAVARLKVLYLAANPAGTPTLRLDEEIRGIEQDLTVEVELVAAWAVRPRELTRHLAEHRPQIVVFSGHGTEAGELLLVEDDGLPAPVGAAALRDALASASRAVELVVLNACFSHVLADTLGQAVAHVVAMSDAVLDRTAAAFVRALLGGLARRSTVEQAFGQALATLALEGRSDADLPKLFRGGDHG